MKPWSGESAPEASMSRPESSREVRTSVSSSSTPSGRGPVPRKPRGDPADSIDIRVAVGLREAEALGEVLAHLVAVEPLDEEASQLQLRAHELRDCRLAGAREPCKP